METTTQSFPLWNYELILFTHNALKKDLSTEFSAQDVDYVRDCIEIQFKRVLNSAYYKDNQICKLINLIVKVSVHYSLNFNDDVEQRLQEYSLFLKDLYLKNKDSIENITQILLLAFYVIQGLFLKENWLGRSFLHKDADDRLKEQAEVKLTKMGMEDRIKPKIIDEFDYNTFYEQVLGNKFENVDLNKYTYAFLKTEEAIIYKSEKLRDYLAVDGEEIFRKLSYMGLLVLLKTYLKTVEDLISVPLPSLNLWKARINFLHNKILNEKLTSLQVEVRKQYEAFFKETEALLQSETEILSSLKVEYGNVLLYYYKYEKSLRAFQEAQALRKLNLKFTGKLGYKTKYQTFETAQLIVETEAQEAPKQEDAMNPEDGEAPVNVDLEEETILLEKPRLSDLNMDNLNKELSVWDQIIVLSLIHHLQKTTPKDDLLGEQVTAYLRSIMEKSQNWLVHSMCLFVRSLNEFIRMKTKERSLLQIQSLIDQFNDKKPKAYERIKYYYSLYYPSFLELQRTMAEKYMEIGMTMSSSELFAKIDMLEDSVECLAMAGHGEKAKEAALKMIEKKPTAKIICIYGELTGDLTYLEKAWNFSNKRFARAKRSEARFNFNRGNFEKAIECYKDSLQVNAYHAASWFTLGCAYLKLQKFQDAVVAFSQVVSIDETQGEAWANMASAFSIQGKKLEAFNALQQSVKHNENSWRIWQNLMFVALECKKFKPFLEAIDKLLKINRKECIDLQVLKKVNQVFLYHIEKAELQDTVELTFMKKRIAGLMKVMEDKLATQPYFWAEYQEWMDLNRYFNERTREIEQTLLNTPDLKPAYVEHMQKRLQDRIPEKEIDEKIAELTMKECHSIMIVGWEIDKKQCRLLEEAIVKMKEAFKKIPDEKQHKQLNIFLDSNLPKIQKTLSE